MQKPNSAWWPDANVWQEGFAANIRFATVCHPCKTLKLAGASKTKKIRVASAHKNLLPSGTVYSFIPTLAGANS
jgi:hypothetical protein